MQRMSFTLAGRFGKGPSLYLVQAIGLGIGLGIGFRGLHHRQMPAKGPDR
jgi:hypothetical protein